MTGTPEIVHHYDAATARRGFWPHALPLHRLPRTVWRSRELVWNFFRRELLGRFRGSAGGVLWVLIQPLFQFLVYFLIFGILFGRGKLLGAESAFFAVYLFSGIVVFNALLEGTQRGLTSILGNANLVRKVDFPCELLPITPVLVAAVVYLVGCVVLVLVGLPLGKVHLGWSLLAWPLLLALLVMMAAGIGMLLAAANVFAGDVQHMYGVLAMAWFFLTPNFWDGKLITEVAQDKGVPWVVDLMPLNPAYCLVMAQRQVFGIDRAVAPEDYQVMFPWSLGQNLLGCGIWALVFLFVGYGFFMSRKHKIVDLV